MSDVEIRIWQLDHPDPQILDQIEGMLPDMYRDMSAAGLNIPLAPGGERAWRKRVASTIGKLGTLVVASNQSGVVGFIHGAIRLLPDYQGAERVGYAGHTYVAPEARGQGAFGRMYHLLEEWFSEQRVHSVENQVLHENHTAIRAWEGVGFQREVILMRKFLS